MLLQSMANTQQLLSFKKGINLCEISTEYPALKEYLTPRHLCTSIKSDMSETNNIGNLSNKAMYRHENQSVHEATGDTKNAKEKTEVIELFHFKQHEEMNEKLYKKCRYYLTKTTSNEKDEKNDSTR